VGVLVSGEDEKWRGAFKTDKQTKHIVLSLLHTLLKGACASFHSLRDYASG